MQRWIRSGGFSAALLIASLFNYGCPAGRYHNSFSSTHKSVLNSEKVRVKLVTLEYTVRRGDNTVTKTYSFAAHVVYPNCLKDVIAPRHLCDGILYLDENSRLMANSTGVKFESAEAYSQNKSIDSELLKERLKEAMETAPEFKKALAIRMR